MRLGIDGKRLVQLRTGPARWLEHMLYHWRDMDVPFSEMRCYTPGPTEHGWARAPTLRHVILPSRLPAFYWEHVRLRAAAEADDVLFGASYTIPLGYRKRSVVSIQGIYEGPHAEPAPWWYRYRYSAMYRSSARRADIVLANSRSTRDDIVRYYGIDPAKIRVVYQGVGAPFGWQEDRAQARQAAAAALGFTAPYFLFVGKMSPRRNVPELVRAFADARPGLGDDFRLVFAGPNHMGLDFERVVAASRVAPWVHHFPHLEQRELADVYSGAVAFFLPTTHEGLSATIIEAMACGTPVVTVDHAPLHEGFAEHALVLEQPTRELLQASMARVSGDEALRSHLGLSGRRCAAAFTWRRTAEETMNVLQEVAEG
jgi:glycosyltransferase involved in cell wall biosynthesis